MIHNDNTNGDIFKSEEDSLVSVFDVVTIRESWLPFAFASRESCGHYHCHTSNVHLLPDVNALWKSIPQTSSVAFASNGYGVLAAVRIRNGELVSIVSMVKADRAAVHKDSPAEDMLVIWMDSVALKLT